MVLSNGACELTGAGLAGWATQPPVSSDEGDVMPGFGESLGEAYWKALEQGDEAADGWGVIDPDDAGTAGDAWQ